MKVLALNPGSGSTKLAFYEHDREVFAETIQHSDEELAPFRERPIWAQRDFRKQAILDVLAERDVDVATLDAVVARGGLLKPLSSGTYRVNARMLEDLERAERGEHASNLGAPLAHEIAQSAGPDCPAFIVDPVSVDEWPPVARLSGLAGLDRECLSHALNTKAVAKRYAAAMGCPYDELRLIVAHLGSGISVSAHENGRMVDVTNSREEGAFSTERAGSIPVMKLVDLCYSGRYTRDEMERMIFREGGLYSYLGTKDLQTALGRADAGDGQARLVVDAMSYQIAKAIGAMASVLAGQIDAVLITGGMAHADAFVRALTQRISWIASVAVYPGEDELQALAEGALRVLDGTEAAQAYA